MFYKVPFYYKKYLFRKMLINEFKIRRIIKARGIFISILSLILAQNKLLAQNNSGKKIIEFGWDYPNVSLLKENISNMEKAPFDGVVFSFDFDIYNAFDTTQRPDFQFQYKDLSEIQWKKFTDNFLFVRGVSISGAHWLDDNSWVKIVKNLKKVSTALAVSKAKGIGFDPEYYYPDSTMNPWVYRASWYNNLSYQEVGNYVRKRGKQFIQALQTNKPDIKILCFWLLGLIEMQSQSQPASETGMALYPFFVEGMLEGQNKLSEIIDGNEFSYGYQNPAGFIEAGNYRRENGSRFVTASLQPKFKNVSLAQAIFFDLIYAKLPEYEKGFDKQTKERWLRDNLLNAFKTTDKYVLFYNERINWWQGKVDSGVANIINDVKNTINTQQNNKSNQIRGNSLLLNFKESKPDSYQGFYYSYTKSTNSLQIKFLDLNISSLKIYNNSRLIYDYGKVVLNSTINLNKIYNKKGNLIIMATDSKGINSIAYVN